MEDIGHPFRLGIWTLKPENRAEFIEVWQTSANWLSQKLPLEKGAILLEDTNDPEKSISVAAVSDPQTVIEAMAAPEYQDLWARVMALIDDVQPHSMRVVGSVTGKSVG